MIADDRLRPRFQDDDERWRKRYHKRRYNQLHHTGHPALNMVVNVDMPADIERVEETSCCFMCGAARAPCRHRPWIEAAA